MKQVDVRKANPHDVHFRGRAKVTWATLAQVRRHGRDHAVRIEAGFSPTDVCVSALRGLDLCGRLRTLTNIKDCVGLCPVSTEEGSEEAP